MVKSTAHVGPKLLKLQPYKTTVVHSLLIPDCEERIQYSRWFQESIFNRLLDPELTFCSNNAWFTLSGYISSQLTDSGAQKILMLLTEVSMHGSYLGHITLEVRSAIQALNTDGVAISEGMTS